MLGIENKQDQKTNSLNKTIKNGKSFADTYCIELYTLFLFHC